jgi:tRNA-2-methylthio-N6-dimethylallyladenosine synthase
MIRRYTVDEYVDRIDALRELVPGTTVSTDVIVGFPGETDEDFEKTLALVERAGFTGLFGFKYSERPGTPAIRLGDDVTEAVKEARLAALFDLSGRLRDAHLGGLVGSVAHVLVEGRGKDEAFTGRTERNEIVHFDARRDVTGEIITVEITRAFKNSLWGEPVEEGLRAGALRRGAVDRRALPMVH